MDATKNQSPAGAMTALARQQIETCRRMADALLDATGKFEQIGLQAARSAIQNGLEAAGAATQGATPPPPNLDQVMGLQRQISETLASTSGELVRLMSEYGSSVTRSFGTVMHSSSSAVPPGLDLDAVAKSWNETMQRFGSLMQGKS